jgi:nucleoside-diphosphate-sugar epimerase
LLTAERQVLAAGGIVARLAGIYGPGRSVILSKFLRGEAVIEDDGERVFNQVHRDDAAAAILHLCRLARADSLTAFGRALFNVADSTPLTQLETYAALARMFERPPPPHGPRDLTRKRGWTHKRVSNAKLIATGWQPQHASFLDAALGIAPTLGLEMMP